MFFLPSGIMASTAAPFSPTDLTLTGWWDPSDISTLWQDTAGTTPVTADGDPVARIDDKSGNGRNLTQSTSTARPLYKTGSGLYWLEFDGIDDQINSGANAFNAFTSGTLDHEVFSAGQFISGVNNFPNMFSNKVLLGDVAAYVAYPNARTSGISGGFYDGTASRTASIVSITHPANFVFYAGYVSSVFTMTRLVDGGNSGTATGTGNPVLTSALQVGGYAAQPANVRFYGGAITSVVLTTTERDDMTTWLGAKAGLSI